MPTNVKSRKPHITNFAHQQALAIPVMMFDDKGQIDLFLFDDTAPLMDQLGMDPTQRIAPTDLANASMLFRVAQDLGLEPGANVIDDFTIFKHLKTLISPNVTNPEMVEAEFKISWDLIAAHDYNKKYQGMRPDVPGIVAYFPFVSFFNDYIYYYLRTLSRPDAIENWHFNQINTLMTSAREGLSFTINPFIQIMRVMETMMECVKDIPNSAKVLGPIKAKLNRPEGKWYSDITESLKFEIEMLLDDAIDNDTVERLQFTIFCIFNAHMQAIHQADKANLPITMSWLDIDQSKNPLYHRLDDPKPGQYNIFEAVKTAVYLTLRDQGFTITTPCGNEFTRRIVPFPIAPKNKAAPEYDQHLQTYNDQKAKLEKREKALIAPLRKKHRDGQIEDYILEALKRKAQTPELRAAADDLLKNKGPQAAAESKEDGYHPSWSSSKPEGRASRKRDASRSPSPVRFARSAMPSAPKLSPRHSPFEPEHLDLDAPAPPGGPSAAKPEAKKQRGWFW